jgi:molecular chaperone DnaJ
MNYDFGDFGDVFSTFFGGQSRSSDRRRTGSSKKRGSDVEIGITITLQEAAAGVTRTIELNTLASCERCKGSGAMPGSSRSTCATCKGSGAVNQQQDTFFGTFQSSTLCPTCGGEGTVVGTPCNECSGQGRKRQRRTVQVSIPAGIADGQTLRLSGQGEAGIKGGPPGDVYVAVRVQLHSQLRREADNLLLNISISFKQASLGDTVSVPTLDGQASLKIPAGTQTGTILKMAGKGMPHLQRSGRGDELVTVTVQTPAKLTKDQRKALEELF